MVKSPARLVLAGLMLATGWLSAIAQNTAPQLSPVIWAQRPGVISGYIADAPQVKGMLNESLEKLTSAQDIGTAWKRLGITPQDKVGIKITTSGGPGFCTHHALVDAIVEGLKAAGVPAEQIVVWDKMPDRMTAAGYAPRPAAPGQYAIAAVAPNNYDPKVTYHSGVIGELVWGDYQFADSLEYEGDPTDDPVLTYSYYTKFVTTGCTKLINAPVLTDDSFIGIKACLGSLALGSVDNNRRFQGPPAYGDPDLCAILNRKFIQDKVVVHILDALVVQYSGGPRFNPMTTQQPGGLCIGRDPVAIDTLALEWLQTMRKQEQMQPITTAGYIADAANYGLGTNNRDQIQLIQVR